MIENLDEIQTFAKSMLDAAGVGMTVCRVEIRHQGVKIEYENEGEKTGLEGNPDKSKNVMILRKRLRLAELIQQIGIALNACHNCVTTDHIGSEPDETHWRIDNSTEIALLDELEAFILSTHISP